MKRILILSLLCPFMLSATPSPKFITAAIISNDSEHQFLCNPTICNGTSIYSGMVTIEALTYLLNLQIKDTQNVEGAGHGESSGTRPAKKQKLNEEENNLLVEYSVLRGAAYTNTPEVINAQKVMPVDKLITENLLFKNNDAIKLNLFMQGMTEKK